MRNGQRGQVGAEFALTLGFLFAVALTGFQFFGLGLTAIKVGHAAQEAAYVAGSDPAAISSQATPCWSVQGGLTHPEGLAQADVCRSVAENLGDLDPDFAAVRVSRQDSDSHATFTVTVSYQQPITSPLLRWLMGPTFVTSSEASSR